MTITSFSDSAFFGYDNLPNSIEFNGCKLIPFKSLKIKYEKNKMSCDILGGAWTMRLYCKMLGIQTYRPMKGLWCVEEKDSKFFDFLYQFMTINPNFRIDSEKQLDSFYNFFKHNIQPNYSK